MSNVDIKRAARRADASALTALVVTYNSAGVLPGLLDTLAEGMAGIDQYEVIVVDNDSHDQSVAIACAHPIDPTVIQMGRNAGYAAGINAATKRSRLSSHIMVLNPDARLTPGSAKLLIDKFADPTVGIAVPRVLHEDGSIAQSLRREPSIITAWSDAILGSKIAGKLGLGEIQYTPAVYANGGEVDWATGAAVAISADAQNAVGDWDESFFLYSEEVEFMRRTRLAGFRILYVPKSVFVHIGGDYHENLRLAALMTANRIRDFRRVHGPVSTVLFRLGIATGSAFRYGLGAGHRAAFRAAFLRWVQPPETINDRGIQPVVVHQAHDRKLQALVQ